MTTYWQDYEEYQEIDKAVSRRHLMVKGGDKSLVITPKSDTVTSFSGVVLDSDEVEDLKKLLG